MLFRKVALLLRTFPCFDLLGMINLREIKNGSAPGTYSNRSSRVIKLAFDPIRITIGVAERSSAIAPLTCMIGADLFRVFLEHHTPHRYVVQIA